MGVPEKDGGWGLEPLGPSREDASVAVRDARKAGEAQSARANLPKGIDL